VVEKRGGKEGSEKRGGKEGSEKRGGKERGVRKEGWLGEPVRSNTTQLRGTAYCTAILGCPFLLVCVAVITLLYPGSA
jgi:hypothetical protein